MKSKSRWQRKIFLSGLLAIITYFCFGGDYNFFNLWKLKQKERALTKQIEATEQEREKLLVAIEKLKNDSAYIEKIAREEYKMGRSGEKIYLIKTEDSE